MHWVCLDPSHGRPQRPQDHFHWLALISPMNAHSGRKTISIALSACPLQIQSPSSDDELGGIAVLDAETSQSDVELLQQASQVNRSPVLYVSGEESVEQLGSRAKRLGLGANEDVWLYGATRLDDILDQVGLPIHAQQL